MKLKWTDGLKTGLGLISSGMLTIAMAKGWVKVDDLTFTIWSLFSVAVLGVGINGAKNKLIKAVGQIPVK